VLRSRTVDIRSEDIMAYFLFNMTSLFRQTPECWTLMKSKISLVILTSVLQFRSWEVLIGDKDVNGGSPLTPAYLHVNPSFLISSGTNAFLKHVIHLCAAPIRHQCVRSNPVHPHYAAQILMFLPNKGSSSSNPESSSKSASITAFSAVLASDPVW
jgi:hypothetical protein